MHCNILQHAKGTCQAEATLTSEKTKPVALAIEFYTCLKALASQPVSHSVENSIE